MIPASSVRSGTTGPSVGPDVCARRTDALAVLVLGHGAGLLEPLLLRRLRPPRPPRRHLLLELFIEARDVELHELVQVVQRQARVRLGQALGEEEQLLD